MKKMFVHRSHTFLFSLSLWNYLIRMTLKLFKSWTPVGVLHPSILKSVDISVFNRRAETPWSVLGASPYFMKAVWGTKALLGRECGLWVSMEAALAHSIKRMCACFLWSQELCLKKFGFAKWPDSWPDMAEACARLQSKRSQVLSFSVQSYSFVLIGYFKFINACTLHFTGSGRLLHTAEALMI